MYIYFISIIYIHIYYIYIIYIFYILYIYTYVCVINLCDKVPFYSNAFVHPCACEMTDLFVNCWIHCSKICTKDSTAWSSALGSTGHNIKPYVSNSTGQQFVQRGEKWNGMKLMWIFNGNPKDLCRYYGHYLHFFLRNCMYHHCVSCFLRLSSYVFGMQSDGEAKHVGGCKRHAHWMMFVLTGGSDEGWWLWSSDLDFVHFETHRHWKWWKQWLKAWAKAMSQVMLGVGSLVNHGASNQQVPQPSSDASFPPMFWIQVFFAT